MKKILLSLFIVSFGLSVLSAESGREGSRGEVINDRVPKRKKPEEPNEDSKSKAVAAGSKRPRRGGKPKTYLGANSSSGVQSTDPQVKSLGLKNLVQTQAVKKLLAVVELIQEGPKVGLGLKDLKNHHILLRGVTGSGRYSLAGAFAWTLGRKSLSLGLSRCDDNTVKLRRILKFAQGKRGMIVVGRLENLDDSLPVLNEFLCPKLDPIFIGIETEGSRLSESVRKNFGIQIDVKGVRKAERPFFLKNIISRRQITLEGDVSFKQVTSRMRGRVSLSQLNCLVTGAGLNSSARGGQGISEKDFNGAIEDLGLSNSVSFNQMYS